MLRAEVLVYECAPISDPALGTEPQPMSLELLRVVDAAGEVEYQIDSQLLSCGGLGAFGLQPLFWGADGQTLWYTTAREGGPDGACRPRVRPMTRVDVTDWSAVTLDQAVTSADGRFETTMRQHGLLRPLKAIELSDGTLRYLLWIAALLTPRPPELLVLNEPETSLHPDLLPALGRLIARAAQHSQVFVVSHAKRLIAALEEQGALSIVLEKELGETRVAGRSGDFDAPHWVWPSTVRVLVGQAHCTRG